MNSLNSTSASNHLFHKYSYNSNSVPKRQQQQQLLRGNGWMLNWKSTILIKNSGLLRKVLLGKMQHPVQPLPRGWTFHKDTQCSDLLRVPHGPFTHGPFTYMQDMWHSARVAALIISVLNDVTRDVSPISTYSAGSVSLALPESACHSTWVGK